MSRADRSLQLRVQEIVANSPVPINVQDAFKQALLERYGQDIDAMAAAFAAVGAATMRGLRKRTYELPETDDQSSLFDVPAVIGISTTEGDLLIPKDQASTGHVRQWTREGLQHHSTQRMRFKRAATELEAVQDIDGEVPWHETRKMLGERKQQELESDE